MSIPLLKQKLAKSDIIDHVLAKKHILGVDLRDICFSEGYKFCEQHDTIPRYGSRWAGGLYFMALYHEIARKRLSLPFFGMGVTTQVQVAGIWYDQPITTQATERECLVIAIING